MKKHVPIKTITPNQINKIYEVLVAALVKSNLPSGPVQQVIEQYGAALADELVWLVRQRVEAVSNIIVRHVAVNRSASLQEVIRATNRKCLGDDRIISPRGGVDCDGEDVFFFVCKPNISDEELEKEYEIRGLKPDPYAQVAVNKADPAFAVTYQNLTPWKDSDGNRFYVAFNKRYEAGVYHSDGYYHSKWWFSGIRK